MMNNKQILENIIKRNKRYKAAYNGFAKISGKKILKIGELVAYSNPERGSPYEYRYPSEEFKSLTEETKWLKKQCTKYGIEVDNE